MSNSLYQGIGRKLKFYRKKAELTQDQLAFQTGLSSKYISNIECERTVPTIQTLIKICEVLKVTPNQILTDSLNWKYEDKNHEILAMLGRCSPEKIKEVQHYIEYIISTKN